MTHQQKLKTVIEKEYILSLLGGGISTSSNIAVKSKCRREASMKLNKLVNTALKDVSRSLSLRQAQPMTDIVLRDTQEKICVPHLSSTFDKTTGTLSAKDLKALRKNKWTAAQKGTLSLSQAMIYTIVRCKLDRRKFRGAVLPFTVSTTSSDDHANMIYLDFQGNRVTCYLFEPNGVMFARTYPSGTKRVRQAWRDVAKSLGRINPEVQFAGGSGLQTELGLKSRFTKQGFAICGAITFWVFTEWIDSGVQSFSDFERALMAKIRVSEKARMEVQLRVLHFIRKVRKHVEKSYTKRLVRALNRDMKVIHKQLKSEFARPGCSATLRIMQKVTTSNPRVKLTHNKTIQV